MGTKKITITLLVLMMAVGVIPALCQEKPADNMQLVLEKIRADKKLLVAENMELTESEAKSFWPVYEQYQDELFLLRVRTVKLIKDYADAYDKMTNETAKKLLDEYMTLEALESSTKPISPNSARSCLRSRWPAIIRSRTRSGRR